jgi:hypothetical protein
MAFPRRHDMSPIWSAGMPDFSWCNLPKREKNIPNDHKILQSPLSKQNCFKIYSNCHKIYQHISLHLPQIGTFGLKIYHLATPLVRPKFGYTYIHVCLMHDTIKSSQYSFTENIVNNGLRGIYT